MYKDEAIGSYSNVHKKEPHGLYSLPNITSMIKSKNMRWVRHVACMGDEKCSKFWLASLRRKYHSEDAGKEWMIVLKWIFKKYRWRVCI
jgi:hypothetical protein